MRSSFTFVALPVTALIAPSAFAVQYLNLEQAQQAIFPGRKFSPAPVKLTSTQHSAIEKKSRVRVLQAEQQVWRVSGGGWFIVDEVVGKHDFITYALGLNADGSVKQIEVMDYRETYGYEIRNEKWRAQFVGKNPNSTLKLDDDIKNISGATLSCRHVTDGVKRLLAFYEVALR
jgi:Na+-translocating ferredoxin:NAD+ oxidoreductase RnfG subunit